MKRALLIAGLCALGAAVAFVGCEVESAADQGGGLTITPTSIGLYPDQTADFTASGGYEYTWSLQDGAGGLLSATSGNTVRYTSRPADSNSTSYDTLTVVSTISSSGSGGSNDIPSTTGSGGSVVSATALIEHLVVTPEPTNTESELQIDPQSVELSYHGSQTFTASGGDGTYAWFLAQSDWGRLTSTDSSQTTYTMTTDPGPGVTNLQVIYVTSAGQTASANILQASDYGSSLSNSDPGPGTP